MVKISKESKLKPEEVMKRAAAFFGVKGYGLTFKEADNGGGYWQGGGGSVIVRAEPGKKGSSVEIESVEWDYQAKEFLGKI
jgi:hypothetical protein